MSEPKLTHQALQAVGLFQRVEVLALHVLDQRHHGGRFVADLAHQHRHAVQPRQPRRAEAPFARDDLVDRPLAVGYGRVARLPGQRLQPRLSVGRVEPPHQDRLHDALRLDGLGQLIQRALVHMGAGLVLAGHQVAQRQTGGLARGLDARIYGVVACGCIAGRGAQQGFQPASQSLEFLGCHRCVVSLCWGEIRRLPAGAGHPACGALRASRPARNRR